MAKKLKEKLDKYQKAVGRCPICGKYPTWFNDIPLTAYCWGTEEDEHEEWNKVIPGKAQPYRDVDTCTGCGMEEDECCCELRERHELPEQS